MKITELSLRGVLLVEPTVFSDNRGYFYESYSLKTFKENGINIDFVQDNQSLTINKNTIRGIHFQKNPMAQTKLVRCTLGKIIDYVVDLRKNSDTYCKWISVELSEENKKELLIPKGFGHAFKSITDNCLLQYKVDNFYDKECDCSIAWNDKDINIDWQIENPILSEKDRNAKPLGSIDLSF